MARLYNLLLVLPKRGHLYVYRLVPVIGQVVSGNADAYTYLPNSLTEFLTADKLAEAMRSVGLQQVCYRRLMLGTVALHVGVKA